MNIEDVHVGMKVRFHPIIGGKHDGNLYEVVSVSHLYNCVSLFGIIAPVDIRAVSIPSKGIVDNYGLPFEN